MKIIGEDDGQFGNAVLDEVNEEIDRFGQPIELFVDASGAVSASTNVSDRWTVWFAANQSRLSRVVILVRSKLIGLTVSIVRHLSKTHDLTTILSDVVRFEAAIAQSVPRFANPSVPRALSAEAAQIERVECSDGSVVYRAGECEIAFKRLNPGVLFLRITGCDAGQFGNVTLDAFRAAGAAHGGPLDVFVDARGCHDVAASVTEQWMTLFRGNPDRIRRAHVLTESKAVRLMIALARELSGTHDVVTVHNDVVSFAAALRRAAPEHAARVLR